MRIKKAFCIYAGIFILMCKVVCPVTKFGIVPFLELSSGKRFGLDIDSECKFFALDAAPLLDLSVSIPDHREWTKIILSPNLHILVSLNENSAECQKSEFVFFLQSSFGISYVEGLSRFSRRIGAFGSPCLLKPFEAQRKERDGEGAVVCCRNSTRILRQY